MEEEEGEEGGAIQDDEGNGETRDPLFFVLREPRKEGKGRR